MTLTVGVQAGTNGKTAAKGRKTNDMATLAESEDMLGQSESDRSTY